MLVPHSRVFYSPPFPLSFCLSLSLFLSLSLRHCFPLPLSQDVFPPSVSPLSLPHLPPPLSLALSCHLPSPRSLSFLPLSLEIISLFMPSACPPQTLLRVTLNIPPSLPPF